MPNEAPYKIQKRGDKFVVVNNAGKKKAEFSDNAKAVDYLRALYANVPGAAKKADKTPWTGKAPKPAKAESGRQVTASLDPETLDRLRRNYAIPAEPAAAKQPVAPAGYDAESEVIKRNAAMPQAQQPHKFKAAEFTHPNGHPRCLLCGQEESLSGVCNDDGTDVPDALDGKQIPVAAGEELQRAFTGVTSISERAPVPQLSRPTWMPDSPGFVTEVNGKTLITAQATVDPALFEKAFSPNEFFLWTQGRLVGADEPNRNGAFWTSGDLELGQATVKYGPLNWLHDGTHVIGTLAEGAFTTPDDPVVAAADGTFNQPHIAVVAPVWKWLFPDEAEVIQMASEAGKFWYSMECVSKSVQCVGDGSCGAEAAYADYIQGRGGSCEHMRQRSATRRFADPTFLGAAVIVPPVRPGWADANANVLQQAASMAEKAFDDAGKPAIPASEWEQLMAQVISYARG